MILIDISNIYLCERRDLAFLMHIFFIGNEYNLIFTLGTTGIDKNMFILFLRNAFSQEK